MSIDLDPLLISTSNTDARNAMVANETSSSHTRQHIYSVSELNRRIKRLLEDQFPFIWISGEISNLRIPTSGHCYLTLKDETAQISAVLFRGQAASLKFKPENGMSIIGLGRIGVYEPRGTYQIILEYLEPKGIGGLQIAFEKLKQKLSDEGLFDEEYKSKLPFLPSKVSIVTSPTGAAVRDFIKVARRRFERLPLEIVPVRVQGDQAAAEIIRAIQLINHIGISDVIVLARGGGSIEDLWAFNDETLARTIFNSRIPIVSAVGHETDFTIADFVADVRAPTPSAAAEMIIPSYPDLQAWVTELKQKLYNNISHKLNYLIKDIDALTMRIVHPRRRLEDMRMRLDDDSQRLIAQMKSRLTRCNERVAFQRRLLLKESPAGLLAAMSERLDLLGQRSHQSLRQQLQDSRARLEADTSMLAALNPLAILERGYSITRTIPGQRVVRDAATVRRDQSLEILLGHGRITVTVDKKQPI